MDSKKINELYEIHFPKDMLDIVQTNIGYDLLKKDSAQFYFLQLMTLAWLTEKYGNTTLKFNEKELQAIRGSLLGIMMLFNKKNGPNNDAKIN